MTIREAVLKHPGADNGADYLDVVLIDRGVDGDKPYTAAEKSVVGLIVADLYSHIVALPDFTEYKLSIKYPRNWFIAEAKKLYIKNGEPEAAKGLGTSLQVPRGKFTVLW